MHHQSKPAMMFIAISLLIFTLLPPSFAQKGSCYTEEECSRDSLLLTIAELYRQTVDLQTFVNKETENCTACFSHPCQNGGACIPRPPSGYMCDCPFNTTGANCQTPVVCTPRSCGRNAYCVIANHRVSCACDLGYSGDPYTACSLKQVGACSQYDPDYTTFDGLHYSYQGTCPYVISEPCNNVTSLTDANNTQSYPHFRVLAQNTVVATRVSAAASVTLITYGVNVTIDSNLHILFNGVRHYSRFFYPNATNWQISVTINSLAEILTNYNLKITFSPRTKLCLFVPDVPALQGPNTLCGLAGNRDMNCRNDLRLRDGSVIPVSSCSVPNRDQKSERFGDDWILPGQHYGCVLGVVMNNNSLPCPSNTFSQGRTECKPIADAASGTGQFGACKILDQVFGAGYVNNFFSDCSLNYCSNPTHNQICRTFGTFFQQCMDAGVTQYNDWREVYRCPFLCPLNAHYDQCTVCPPTCSDTGKGNCTDSCVEECVCNAGLVWDPFNEKCIPLQQCGCVDEAGNYYGPDTQWKNENCTVVYKCHNGKITSQSTACAENATCVVVDSEYTCQCKPGFNGTGMVCQDINECLNTTLCHESSGHGMCVNTIGSYYCVCNPSYQGSDCQTYAPRRNCADLYTVYNDTTSGIKTIYPSFPVNGQPPFTGMQVLCDMSNGGGWTVFSGPQGNQTSIAGWSEYERGFGTLANQDFWLGLSFLHGATKEFNTSLRIELNYCDGTNKWQLYSVFSVMDAASNYSLVLNDEGSGTAGDAIFNPNWPSGVGPAFSAVDRDNADLFGQVSCSILHGKTGWWFEPGDCGTSNLNGIRYPCSVLNQANSRPSSLPSAITWQATRYPAPHPLTAIMKLRPNSFPNYDSSLL